MPAVFWPRTYQISNVRKSKALILKALDVYYAMALSKRDLKAFLKYASTKFDFSSTNFILYGLLNYKATFYFKWGQTAGGSTFPLAWTTLIPFILSASLNLYAFYTLGLSVFKGPFSFIFSLTPPILIALGGAIEGLFAETIFDQKIHAIAVILFNLGEIISNIFASRLIRLFNEKIVGGYFSIIASIILASSIIIFDIYLIAFCAFIFGFGTANFLGIVLREGVKASQETLSVSVSNLMTIGFSGFIFGPALIGFSAEYFGLTFNMYMLCLIWFLNATLFIYVKNKLQTVI